MNKKFMEKNKYKIILFTLISIVLIISLGLTFAPRLFYDQWIWKHYVGPLVADAVGHNVEHNGVVANEGYTLLSEITYGIILVLALYFIYKLLKKLDVKIDGYFCIALLPYILFGPVSRVLEDSNFFKIPIAYLFISPLIYFLIGLYTIFILILGKYMEKRFSRGKSFLNAVFPFILVLLIINGSYAVLWMNKSIFFSYDLNPIVLWFSSGLALLLIYFKFVKIGKIDFNYVLFSGGLLLILPSAYLIGLWIYGYRWNFSHGTYLNVLLVVVSFSLLITLLVYIFSYLTKKKNLKPYRDPVNLLMIFGHMLDGLTSWFSLKDPLGLGLPLYGEKHPIPNLLMSIWGPLYPITKFILIVMIIYLIDVYYKDEFKKAPLVAGLLKICIIILGFAPGTRDILRVVMGV